MNYLIKFVILITFFGIKRFVSEFITLGEYSDYEDLGVNLPHCGLEFIPTKYQFDIHYPKKCFREEYQNTTYFSFSRIQETLRIENISERIYRGQNVKSTQQPWVVLVEMPSGATCTGTLITFQWVITAASCYEDVEDIIVVRSGPDREQWLDIRFSNTSHFYRHPKFISQPKHWTEKAKNRQKFKNDMALIKLDTPFDRNHTFGNRYLINTVCLSQPKESNTKNETAIIVGYGPINRFGVEPFILQMGYLELLPVTNCPYKALFCSYHLWPNISRPCFHGDFGGPLIKQIGSIKRNILIGTFLGYLPPEASCGPDIWLSIWVPVPNFIGFILKTIDTNS